MPRPIIMKPKPNAKWEPASAESAWGAASVAVAVPVAVAGVLLVIVVVALMAVRVPTRVADVMFAGVPVAMMIATLPDVAEAIAEADSSVIVAASKVVVERLIIVCAVGSLPFFQIWLAPCTAIELASVASVTEAVPYLVRAALPHHELIRPAVSTKFISTRVTTIRK